MPLPYDIKDVIEEQIPFSQTMNLRKRHIGPSCELFFRSDPIKIIRGQGQYLYSERNEEFLDSINNVCHVGHCHPDVVRAGQNQMAILNTNSRFLHDNLVLYAKKLTSKFPEKLEIVFFVNSGSEANDLALRLSKSHTQSEEVIALEHAYHGNVRSLIEISPYKFAKGYTPPSTVHIVPVPDTYRGKYRNDKYTEEECANHYANEIKTVIDSLENEGKKLGCFIAESLQSCGGQVIYPQGYLRKVYDHVHENGGVVIADEVQVGFGRVGSSWWAFETQGSDLVPDIVTLGKPMGNGHPVAAVVTTKEIADSFCSREKEYFNTFGGNPVSCAISNAVLDVIEKENLMKKAQENGDHLITEFKKLSQKYDIIGDVRGWGMFVGVDLVKDRTTREAHTSPAKFMVQRLREEKILAQYDGPYCNVLKFKPPLAFTKENCDRLIQTMDRIFEKCWK
ncbi:LOW QUALITY PROTEIN: ethanolamine-phosphate phospho-lyase-like [Lepeophtheirus salmonis]|uniref:LOW QUALITY PROTEIN: ethanolamine-phosphate phospho-lyase-like n=1 Tax=Lepeophtheirus salmonis TaxID=72036 RepID=UPI003AF34FD5